MTLMTYSTHTEYLPFAPAKENPTTYHVESRLNEIWAWEFLSEHDTHDEAETALDKLVNEDADFQPDHFYFYRIVKVEKQTLIEFQRKPE